MHKPVGDFIEERELHTAEDVVAAARPKSSPLHTAFEWDDGEAAKQHRLLQARHLLASVIVTYDEAPDVPIRAYVVVDDDGRRYESTRIVMTNAGLRKQVIDRARREAKQWAERYRLYREFGEVVQAIDVL